MTLDDIWNGKLSAATCIIAEAGVNHNGNYDLATRLIDAAVESGADVVKFQAFVIDAVVSDISGMAAYQKRNIGQDISMRKMLEDLELPLHEFEKLKAYCDKVGIEFMASAFDLESIRFLDEIGMSAFKIASGEITTPLILDAIGCLSKPVILSSGMATLGEVESALRRLETAGTKDIAILHCVSDYPANPADANLRAIDSLRYAFGRPVGWSDHTLGDSVAIAAVARGARIIEKHFTLDCALPGPDHKASLEPAEFRKMVQNIRTVERALGDGQKRPTSAELEVRKVARRSVFAAREIQKGAIIVNEDFAFLRPGTGISPMEAERLVGQRCRQTVPAGTLLQFTMFE